MPVLILNRDDVQKVVDKLPEPAKRREVVENLRDALRLALPAIAEASAYFADAERTLSPLYDTVPTDFDEHLASIGVDPEEVIGNVHSLLFALTWACNVDERDDMVNGVAQLREALS